ncbi:MAG TPA: Asd/ArgC dimerization domain-containing protein [Acidobacteriaceae bacterium]|jgi:aspartate-semialdehyde dehydrogenase|nr:Asd/ArgC dimerization domain-containing protein [Acidobacteriaceae bacterium]
MQFHSQKIAIVGAATLLGKELNEVLSSSAFVTSEFILMDDEEALGKIEAAGDEVTFVQRIEPESFQGCDFVFFAAQPEITEKHWQQARKVGACVIDLTGVLENKPGVVVLAPWLTAELAPRQPKNLLDLKTAAVVPAHPAAMLLALVAARCQCVAPVHALWATLLQAASEYGNAAIVELHQQTVNLLSFQPLPTDVFGSQAAFNLALSFGEEGRVRPIAIEEIIQRHYAAIADGRLATLGLQVVQAPIFHGYVVSVAVELESAADLEKMRLALTGEHVELVTESGEAPGNIGVTGGTGITVFVRSASADEGASTRYWLWITADNLRLAAVNAVACAVEMGRLRPQGKVQ